MRSWLWLVASACSFPPGVVPVDAVVSADLAAWSYRREITINNMGLGAHKNFPLAVMLDGTRVRYTPQGDDLRFTDATKALLPYEIDTWNQLGDSVVWVGVPEIAANATTLWMYYGNPEAPAAQRAAAVWDQDYVGVWHLTDAHDSTGRNNSTSVGATPLAGAVGGAVRVVGSGQYIDTGAADQLATWTIEVWMSPALPATTNNSSGPLSRGSNYQMQWNCGDVQYCKSVNLIDQSGTVIAVYGGGNLAAGVWHHVAARYDGATLETYVGDARTASVPAQGPPDAETGTTKLGARVNLSGYYAGDIDEVRISRVARSADYLKAQHRAQVDTYVTVGPELANP